MAISKSDITTGFNNNVVANVKGQIVWDSSNYPNGGGKTPASLFSDSVQSLTTVNSKVDKISASDILSSLSQGLYDLSKVRLFKYIDNNTGNRGKGETITTNLANMSDGYKQTIVNSLIEAIENTGIRQGDVMKPIDWATVYAQWEELCKNEESFTYTHHSSHGNRSRR